MNVRPNAKDAKEVGRNQFDTYPFGKSPIHDSGFIGGHGRNIHPHEIRTQIFESRIWKISPARESVRQKVRRVVFDDRQ